jgi:hypothetical protein
MVSPRAKTVCGGMNNWTGLNSVGRILVNFTFGKVAQKIGIHTTHMVLEGMIGFVETTQNGTIELEH